MRENDYSNPNVLRESLRLALYKSYVSYGGNFMLVGGPIGDYTGFWDGPIKGHITN